MDSSAIMFCPICRTIFSEGMRRCSACQVELVSSLDEVRQAGGESPHLLWSGFDQRTCSEICAALKEAGIAYDDQTPSDYFLLASMRPRFEIRILASDRDRAAQVLAELELNKEDPNPSKEEMQESWFRPRASQSESEQPYRTGGGDASYPPEDWDPERATGEVWTGEDEALAQLLQDCFRENGIGSRLSAAKGPLNLFVHPEDVSRAREIVREVIEGTPPA